MLLTPDPTFYPSARLAMQAPVERLAYVALLNPKPDGRPDGMAVVDVDPTSNSYGRVVGRIDMPNAGDELHHFGWNACSSALCPYAPHPHIERRYLITPGLRSSRIYVIDTKPDPRQPKIIKVIEPEEVATRAGYSRTHTVHCGPDGIYISALGAPDGGGPGGIFLLDHFSFNVLGRWEMDRGPQNFAYDFWWHLGQDTMLTSEWGTPNMLENGLNPELLLAGKYGHSMHFWDLRKKRHQQAVDLGSEQQLVLELRPAHDPTRAYGFVGVVVSLKDLSSSIWLWTRDNGKWGVKKVIEIPAEPADPELLPPLLKGFKAVPPLLTDIDLSLDDRFLYASCWGTGEMRQYDVSDPHHPQVAGRWESRRAPHPQAHVALNGGPDGEVSATAGVYFASIRFIRRGMRNFIRKESGAGW
jgi:selenium-binding protein 1